MKSDLTLYNITEEFSALERLLEMDEGEITPELELLQHAAYELLAQKTDGYVGFVDKLKNEIEQAGEAMQRLKAFVEHREKCIDRCNRYVKDCMMKMGASVIKGKLSEIKLTKPRQHVEIIDRDKIPPEFITIKQEIAISKKEIGDKIRAGEEVPGAMLVNGEEGVKYSFKTIGGKNDK